MIVAHQSDLSFHLWLSKFEIVGQEGASTPECFSRIAYV
jgi:hypothetical protein